MNLVVQSPYLTFLNVHHLERQGADIQTKVEELEQLNQSMRDRDKMKDDAIAHLSDQLIDINIIQRIYKINRRIFQNQTFQSEYEELSACKHWLPNCSTYIDR